MKWSSFIFVFLISGSFVFSQNNVGIGTTTPNPNALLDLQNNSSPLGLLLPRQDISSFSLGLSDAGMLVFNPVDNKIYTWDGTGWISGVSEWGVNGNNIFNLNSGNVGIGTSTPSTKLEVQATGAFAVRLKSTESNSSAYSELEFGRDNGIGGFFKTGGMGTPGSGDYLQISSPQFIDFVTNFSPRMRIDNSGNVGIGTSTPGATLDVTGNSIRLNKPATAENLTFRSDGLFMDIQANNSQLYISAQTNQAVLINPNSSGNVILASGGGNTGVGITSPTAKLHVNGTGIFTGRVELTNATDASGVAGTGVLEIAGALRIDGNEIITNTNSTLFFQNDNNGDLSVDAGTFYLDASANTVGIGTTTINEKLHIYDASAPTLRLTSSATTGFSNAVNSGTIQLLEASAAPGAGAYGGGITYDGNANLLKFQTYENTTINDAIFISRTSGNVGIKGSPAAELDVYGSVRVQNEVNRPSTGAANLVPIAYGHIGSTGTIEAGSGNISVTNPSTGRYEITITGESYFYLDYATIITPVGSGKSAGTDSIGGRLLVWINNSSGTAVNSNFQFVVYKP